MNQKILSILFFLIVLINCTNKKENNKLNEKGNFNFRTEASEKLKYESQARKALLEGNVGLYSQSSSHLVNNPSPEHFLYYSNAMALKYNYYLGYLDTYYIYSRLSGVLGDKENPLYNFALYNLAKAIELGCEINKEYIGNDTITQDNIKSSEYYLKKAYPEYNISKKK